MNGAESLLRTLLAGGVDTCFANPGTSEMYFIEALDRIDEMRCVLCLHENVATGAADGYARMLDRPASTLLHLGPGLANGLSNLHNASRAYSPIVNVIGDHATYHKQYDAPLTADIEAIAAPFSDHVQTVRDVGSVGADTATAIAEARKAPGRISTLIAPAETTWLDGAGLGNIPPVEPPRRISDEAIREAARIIRSGRPSLLLLTGKALRADALQQAGRIARAFPQVEVMAQTSNGRIERGHGRFPVERIPYPVAQALKRLERFEEALLVGAKEPVAFFAYPDRPSKLLPEACRVTRLTRMEEDGADALLRLARELGADQEALVMRDEPAPAPAGPLTPETLALALGDSLPENAIVVDESVSVGRGFYQAMRASPAHDWLQVTGGAIGNGLPMAAGAAIACPDRRVICLEGDGSAMYTVQSLWTMAREKLDVTTVILDNQTYAILHGEFSAIVGERAGARAAQMLDIDGPGIDWLGLAASMGVPASRVTDVDSFITAFEKANRTPGPHLIDAVISA